MLSVLLTGFLSFVISFFAIPAIMRVASEKKLYDLPDARKLHTKAIASLGGVGIFIGFALTCLLTIPFSLHPEVQACLAAALVIFFLGLKDDILILSPTKKFLGQLLAAAIVIHLGHLRIDSMHGFLGFDTLPMPLNYLFSYATVIVVINAYNLIDGVDGLAGSLGVLTTGIFGFYFFSANMPAYAMLSWSMTGALIGFLVFNYHPAKIFMGDSGSLLLGLINSVLVIKFIAVADTSAVPVPMSSAVAIGFSILIVPLVDTLRVFSIRIAKKRSPFSPDRNHIHHLLLDRGLNHRAVTLICLGMNFFFVALAYTARPLGSTILILLMAGISFALVGALLYFRKPTARRVIVTAFQHAASEPMSATKVVTLKNEVAAIEQ